jgi:hypothetical protein
MQANAAKKRLMRTAKAYPDEIRAATQAGSELAITLGSSTHFTWGTSPRSKQQLTAGAICG